MNAAQDSSIERVYVWQLPVRLAHWSLVVSIIALTATGLYIAHPFVSSPGEASAHFVMGWMRTVHLAAAILFGLAVLVRIVWMFVGAEPARWEQLIPTTKERWVGLFRVMRFYALPRGAYPYRERGHNPLAGLSYFAFYLVALLLLLSGLGLHSLEAGVGSPMRWFDALVPLFGGAQRMRFIHHAMMWASLLFAMAHVYICVFVARVEGNGIIDAIVTGFKFVHRRNTRATTKA